MLKKFMNKQLACSSNGGNNTITINFFEKINVLLERIDHQMD